MYSNLIIYSPLNEIELRNILYTAQLGLDHPIAIRYPVEEALKDWIKPYEKISIGKAKCLAHGTETAVLSNGPIGKNVSLALANLDNQKYISL
jgi:1-deoxy-D-xylulose-5-phosphate synthase